MKRVTSVKRAYESPVLLRSGIVPAGHDKAGNAPNVTDGSLAFPDLNAPAFQSEDLKKNLIMPESCAFTSENLPPCSTFRPTGTRRGGSVATIESFRQDGLFMGQGNVFTQFLFTLAGADRAKRELFVTCEPRAHPTSHGVFAPEAVRLVIGARSIVEAF
jgi:hypothetical protein